jgi:glycosyltransferase involved in cell wall biosynthesis
MAVLEAMACGLPAIGTPVGVLPEVAAAQLAWEAETIAGQAVTLWRDSAGYKRAAGEAAKTVAQRYSLPAAMHRFDNLYAQLLA